MIDLPTRRCLIPATLVLSLASAGAHGQILSDGDFDALSIGSNPNCTQAAGAWEWPPIYVSFGLCELLSFQIFIVSTGVFDPGAPGNSLGLHNHAFDTPPGDIHLPNLFNQIIHEATDPNVTVTFDIWVNSGGGRGGCIYVSGNHGGGGFDASLDIGPQLCWTSSLAANPRLNAVGPDGPIPLIGENYPTGLWTSLRLEIDLAADNYDVFVGITGNELTQFGNDLPFRAGSLDHLDRFTIARLEIDANSYFDNIEVTIEGACPWDCGGDNDGDVGIVDFLALLAQWGGPGPCDLDGGGGVGITDLLELLANWGPCP